MLLLLTRRIAKLKSADISAHVHVLGTTYVEIFAVDLISLFSRVHAPTAKLKTTKYSFSNPHTMQHITDYRRPADAIYTEASITMQFVVCCLGV